jgi:5'-3' exonuclease
LMSSIDSPIIDYYPSNFNVNILAQMGWTVILH